MLPTTNINSNNPNHPSSNVDGSGLGGPSSALMIAYEGWVERTPWITRGLLTIQWISCIVGWFVNVQYGLSTIPYFVIFHLELYRLILSPFLVNNTVFSCLLATLSFSDHGKRLEHSMGSAAFAWLTLTIGLLTNLTVLILSLLLTFLSGQPGFLFVDSSGLWTILFGIIALDCVQAPRNSKRSVLFFTVPVLYYPLVLFAFFFLMSSTSSGNLSIHSTMPYWVSMGVGYAYGLGYLDSLKLNPTKIQLWEDTILTSFAHQNGWITGNATSTMDHGNSSSWQGTPSWEGGINTTTVPSSSGSIVGPTSISSGRALGGPTATTTQRRMPVNHNTAAETRAARLQALEQRGKVATTVSPDTETGD